ncbi:WbqC family protein [Streptomyces sp. NBC_01267]|uniref:WbqC family protein n=1 Tax=Streptomyces sp. NBC_01267 TaxID=2903805 RepID=UPI002E309EC6|nr:WbqC family protein [Streptomyces sp. NBC_01267]
MPPTNLSSPAASTAASSRRELPPSGGLCAIHQPNPFPWLTTVAKLFAAGYWIVLDDVQFTRRDYQHRARLAALGDPLQRQWLSLPTHLPDGRLTTIRNVLIVDPMRSRQRIKQMLRQYFGSSPHRPALYQASAPVLDLYAVGVHWALGDAGAALEAGRDLRESQFATAERKARMHTDLGRAWWQWGKAEQTAAELLAAMRVSPGEIRDRPAIRKIVDDLRSQHSRVTGVRELVAATGMGA